MHPGSPAQGIDLQSGVVRNHNLYGHVATVLFRLLARVLFERMSIFDDEGQGREVWDSSYLEAMYRSCASKISQLARIGCGNKDRSHMLDRSAAFQSAGRAHQNK